MGNEVDSDTISINAVDKTDARTKAVKFLQKIIKAIDGKLNLLQ